MKNKTRYYIEAITSFIFFLGGMALCAKGYPVIGFCLIFSSHWAILLFLPMHFKD